mmetsp:Transcript_45305/g.144378  ORF Transcript_45305/g.144378 Transcript_45305/m.144378 type:complete len:202 (+) Transcript_45305:419-1024(+)
MPAGDLPQELGAAPPGIPPEGVDLAVRPGQALKVRGFHLHPIAVAEADGPAARILHKAKGKANFPVQVWPGLEAHDPHRLAPAKVPLLGAAPCGQRAGQLQRLVQALHGLPAALCTAQDQTSHNALGLAGPADEVAQLHLRGLGVLCSHCLHGTGHVPRLRGRGQLAGDIDGRYVVVSASGPWVLHQDHLAGNLQGLEGRR